MIENGVRGSIVNWSSVSALDAAPYHGPYGAAKAGVAALTKTMAVEWGPLGIRVNAVAPGATRSGQMGTRLDASAVGVTHQERWNPIPRKCEPEEIASAMLFLISDLASGITGHLIAVDSGVMALSSLGDLDHWAETAEFSKQAQRAGGI
jgi:NAD(P)-dependent dehydrogenase (short-subunit alcohol dehydrogenase family)